MIHRYEGNTGRMRPMPEPEDLLPPLPPEPAPLPPPRPETAPPPRRPRGFFPGFADLSRILPGAAEFETEDLLLLLILYLLYRESGDEELLIILGAMFLL